jgi:hypothetical protein
VVAFICGATARDMRLSCNGPAMWAPGAIPTVDFLLYRFGAVVKKMGVKSHDGILRRIRQVACMERSEIREAAPDFAALHPGYGRTSRPRKGGLLVNNNESTTPLPPLSPAPGQRALRQMKRAAPRRPIRLPYRWRDSATHEALVQRPGPVGAGRNSNCGFSPIRFRRGRQKNGCQES